MGDLFDLSATAVAFLFIIITHEMAHGYVALLNGDDTAKMEGRLTFNPIAHIDWIGLMCLIIFHFGWAKPVPINPNKFRYRRSGLLTTALAGVCMNLLTAALAIYLFQFIPHDWLWIKLVVYYIALYGIAFCVFNLIPIPPLDGSKVIMSFLPDSINRFIYANERYFYILLILLISGGFVGKIISPTISYIYEGLLDLIYGVL